MCAVEDSEGTVGSVWGKNIELLPYSIKRVWRLNLGLVVVCICHSGPTSVLGSRESLPEAADLGEPLKSSKLLII